MSTLMIDALTAEALTAHPAAAHPPALHALASHALAGTEPAVRFTALQDLQIPILALTLLAAALAKLAVRDPRPASETATGGMRFGRPLAICLILAEGVLGVGLLVTTHRAVRLGTALGFAGALWVVGELKASRPEAGCGCFGGLSTTRIGRRTLIRTTLFTVAAIVSLSAPHTGLEVLRDAIGWKGALLLLEVAAFAALSPELGAAFARWRSPVPCERRPVPLSDSLAALTSSEAWRTHRTLLTSSEPIDVWRELCWRFLVYPGLRDGIEVEVVFAVSLEGRRPQVRGIVVDSGDDDDDDSGSGPHHPFAVTL